MKTKLIAIVAAALLLQSGAQAGPFRSVTAIGDGSEHIIDVAAGMAVTVLNFSDGRTTNLSALFVLFGTDAPVLVATATPNGVEEVRKDLVISARGADGRPRPLKLKLAIPSGNVCFLSYKLSGN
jgi:hypothetical protein